MFLLLFTFILALGLSLYLTPLSMEAARTLGIMAEPDGELRTHKEEVPYLGGMAVYLSLLIALAVAVDFSPRMLGLLLGTTIILMVGLIDDFGVMTAKMKLFGQFLAAVALIKGGVVVELQIFRELNWPYDLPLLSWGVSILWLTGIANAVNFLDIEDGLAAGVAACCCPALIAIAWINGNTAEMLFTAALLGALIGFLRYNAACSGAKIYLGDAGSLMLGMTLAALAMMGEYSIKNDLAAVAPIIILGVPCFEIGVTMLARLRKGIPVYYGSPDHVSKRLHFAGLSKRNVVLLHGFASLVLGGVAILAVLSSIRVSIILVSATIGVGLVTAFLLLRIKTPTPEMPGDSHE